MPTDSDIAAVRERYARFARDEASHRSPLYAQWAACVADDETVAEIIARLAPLQRQPALVFAVTRMLGVGLIPAAAWASWLKENAAAVVAETSLRGVQTNEPLRCAALLPALARIDGPIALVEVGASAGLCLYPDRYSYRYRTAEGTVAIDPAAGVSTVVLEAEWRGPWQPLRPPEVVWRAGIDLQPRDAADPADRAWLTGLVWPGETERARRVNAALDIVAADPPRLVAGDAGDTLADVVAGAPREATLVVTTPGVLAHVPRAGRERIIAAARRADHWVTMDAAGLHSATDGAWHPAPDPHAWPNGTFVLALDGEVSAAVDPLGGIVAPIGGGWEWHPAPSADRG
ncbi:DUF2332 domain-containing protein [Microbacterium horticulturae]|uniref:DUF2332 domain-containing protein n=1 Tax=Microbacterium horticulturae TaxID=3028316 RepID=A0ABY8C0C8_9MICO|nr:DUF2332 domain-containing protein [Microbacterium sp. KACC 23027]WEG09859.1 DUF2332 domain-containing protein [Microbacterium sp. KACC 23027]